MLSESRRPDHRKLRELEILELVGWLAAGCWRPSGVSEFEEVGGKVVYIIPAPFISCFGLFPRKTVTNFNNKNNLFYINNGIVSDVTCDDFRRKTNASRHVPAACVDIFRPVVKQQHLWHKKFKINQFKFKLILFFFK